MAKLPFMPFYPSDWVSDTRILSPQAKGAWIDLLCFLWNQPKRGQMVGDLLQLARICGVTDGTFERIFEELKSVADIKPCPQTSPECPRVFLVSSRRMVRDETTREYEKIKKRWQREKELSLKCPPNVPQDISEVIFQKSEKDKRESAVPAARATRKIFQKPTPEEVTAYAKTQYFKLNGQAFCDFYEARGWQYKSGQPMRDWRAAVRTWKSRAEPAAIIQPPPKPKEPEKELSEEERREAAQVFANARKLIGGKAIPP